MYIFQFKKILKFLTQNAEFWYNIIMNKYINSILNNKKSNIFSNVIILLLLLGNIYLTFQYVSTSNELRQIKNEITLSKSNSNQATEVLKLFLDVVYNTRGIASVDDRIKLENEIRQIKDPEIIKAWEDLISSKDSKTSQAKAIKILGLLEDRI